MYGRILGIVRRSIEYSLECTKLLLQVSPTSPSSSCDSSSVDDDEDDDEDDDVEPAFGCDGYADTYRRCGNMASILEVSPGGKRFFNVFEAAPENESDGPAQQQQQVKVSLVPRISCTGLVWRQVYETDV